jgi:hypothetical protein
VTLGLLMLAYIGRDGHGVGFLGKRIVEIGHHNHSGEPLRTREGV